MVTETIRYLLPCPRRRSRSYTIVAASAGDPLLSLLGTDAYDLTFPRCRERCVHRGLDSRPVDPRHPSQRVLSLRVRKSLLLTYSSRRQNTQHWQVTPYTNQGKQTGLFVEAIHHVSPQTASATGWNFHGRGCEEKNEQMTSHLRHAVRHSTVRKTLCPGGDLTRTSDLQSAGKHAPHRAGR